MLLQKAVRDLEVRRVRTTLTIIGILVGVAGLVAILTTAQGFAHAQQQAFATGQRADFAIYLADAPLSLQRAAEGLPGVQSAGLRFNHYGRGRLGTLQQDLHFIGVRNFEAVAIEAPVLVAGRLPAASDEALLEPAAATQQNLTIGDTLSYFDLASRERLLTIVGLAQLPTTLSADITGIPLVFVPEEVTRRMRAQPGYNELLVRFDDSRPRREVGDDITALLTQRRIPQGEGRYSDPSNYAGKRELDTLFIVLYLFSGLGVVLSSFIVANTLAALVAESIREVGILKALGATRQQVLTTFLLIAGLLGVVGTLLGLVVGTGLGWILLKVLGNAALLNPPLRLEPTALGLGSVVGMVVTLIGGAIPAWNAANLTAKAALEDKGVSTNFGTTRLDRWLQTLVTLPPLVSMALRNLLRRKARSGVTVMVVAVAVAGLLAAQATDASVANALQTVFETYRADGYLQFGVATTRATAGTLRRLPSVTDAEGWFLRTCTADTTRTRCWALPADSQLYNPHLVAGAWLYPDDPLGVVITQDLADDAGLAVGDTFPLRYQEQERTVRVRGIIIDNAIFLGSDVQSKIFLAYSTFATLAQQSNGADIFAVGLAPRTQAAQQTILDAIRQRLAPLRPNGTLALTEFITTQAQTNILTATLRGMVVLVALIGAVGLVNTLALTVIERRREIGVLRALGTDDRQMGLIFMTEGLGLGVMGWAVGLVLGWGIARLFVAALGATLFEFPFYFPLELVGWSLLFAVGLALAASLAPAFAAANLPTLEAIRYE